MTTAIYFTDEYTRALERIKKFIFDSTENIGFVDQFLNDHDEVLSFLSENPKTAATHPLTGDQSWLFANGRYRIFFKTVVSDSGFKIYLIHIIDNRESNLEIYPNNSIPTYDED